MMKSSFCGTHREVGFHWGAEQLSLGRRLLDEVPFPLTDARREYADACVPLYRAHFPEILEEIQGIAEGQRCDAHTLRAVMLGMYAIQPACSVFAVSDGSGALLGRNSDFLTALEPFNLHVCYHLPNASFIGNTTAFVEMEDGVNGHGLAAGLTNVPAHAIAPGFNAGMLLRDVLEHCRDVPSALSHIRKVRAASGMALVLADRTGNIALVERDAGAMEVEFHAGGEGAAFVCAANAFHLPGMRARNLPGIDNWRAEERYETLTRALSAPDARCDAAFARELLSGGRGFLCQYDRNSGHDTVWSAVYHPARGQALLAPGNPARTAFEEVETMCDSCEYPHG